MDVRDRTGVEEGGDVGVTGLNRSLLLRNDLVVTDLLSQGDDVPHIVQHTFSLILGGEVDWTFEK